MTSLLPALAFAAVIVAQFASVIAAAVETNAPGDREPARAMPAVGNKAEYRS